MKTERPRTTSGPERDFVGYGPSPPDITWPGGASIAVNIVINYEEGAEYSLEDDGVNDTWGEYSTHFPPDVRDMGTETHMEYGSRVGIWRLCRLFDELAVDVTVAACALAIERNPPFADWMRNRDHDILGHGYRWYGGDAPEALRYSRDVEQDEIKRAIESLERTTGKKPRGWMVRSFPTVHTRELLVEEGQFLYDSDASNDELPYYVRCLERPFLVVPYSKVYNDVRYLIAPTYSSPRDFTEVTKLGLDYMVAEAECGHGGRMMTVGLHSRWSGQAARASAVREFVEYVQAKSGACFMRRAQIAEHWMATHPPADDAS